MVRLKNRYLLLHLIPLLPPREDKCKEGDQDERVSRDEDGGGGNRDEDGSEMDTAAVSEQLARKRSFGRYCTDTPPTSAELTSDLDQIDVSTLNAFTVSSVSAAVRRAVELNYGLSGASSLTQSLSVKYSNAATGMAIIRVPRDFAPRIWAAITCLSEWPAEKPLSGPAQCIWRVVHCAGTIRSCQTAAISFARKQLLHLSSAQPDKRLERERLVEGLAKRIKSLDP